ncbi:transposase [Caloramator fervidus]|uniref:transposase n=1 Tax=Caloramator fervidus TaxID=29344 RepID=UPI001A9A37F6
MVSYSTHDSLPEVISIDEFKGNSGNSDYYCIIVDPVNHKIIDIIKDKNLHVLSSYFRKIKNRDKVKYVIIDMWKPYVEIVKAFFKNTTIIIDKFHFMRYRRYYKRSKKLILTKYESLYYASL